ncbi:MAG: efflux RND transporter periplasmic adaptor subunit [Bryobacteraceae bacterium]|nr:efflux RND transporter periplasmic adaptor subunit [Bryobacteraceae bacterium]
MTIVLTGCKKEEHAAERQPVAVRTVAAEITNDTNEIRYSGIVMPNTQVDLAFRIPGYVEQIGMAGSRELQEGDVVAAGTVLARLRASEYQTRVGYAQSVAADATASLEGLRAQLNEAEAGLAQAVSDFDRASALFSERALTKADFDAAQTRKNTAAARKDALLAQLAAQRARIEGAGTQQREASLTLADTILTAPFAGVVISKRIARGSLVSAGAPAFAIADTRTAKVSFGVPDMALGSFPAGRTLTVSAEAIPDQQFQGTISTISPAADPTSRVFGVEVAIPNAKQLLRIGMVATVIAAPKKEPTQTPSIPLAAVVKSPSDYGVYTVEQNKAHLQPVTLGAVRGNAVAIVAGLNPGQRVIATGGLQLADGEEVKLIP